MRVAAKRKKGVRKDDLYYIYLYTNRYKLEKQKSYTGHKNVQKTDQKGLI